MTNANYDLTVVGDGGSVSFVLTDECRLVTLTSTEAPEAFPKVVETLLHGGSFDRESLDRVLDPSAYIIKALDPRVSVNTETGVLLFDGEPVHGDLAATIVRYYREGRDTSGLVLFLENLAKNPSRRSRERLFEWTKTQELRITPDGHFIGYKGVQADHTSKNAGPATVNGVEMNGHIPNEVGSVIEVPREYVDDDYNNGCSHGLHVGNYRYARNWASVLLEVKVNPADVVTVPTSDNQKLRVCRYEVLALHEPQVEDDAEKHESPAGEIEYDDADDPQALDYEKDFEAPLESLGIGQRFLAGLRRSLGRGRKAEYDDGAV